METLKFDEFMTLLNIRAAGRKYKEKSWSNYPTSIFYYWDDDEQMQNEIAAFTSNTTYGIYI